MSIPHPSEPGVRKAHPGLKDYPKLTVTVRPGTGPNLAILEACAVGDRKSVAVVYNVEFDSYTVWCLPRDREPKEA
jgi:hypothetical protein